MSPAPTAPAPGVGLRWTYHVNVNCSDLDRSVAFYEDLGFERVVDFGTLAGDDLVRGLGAEGATVRAALMRLGPDPRSCHLDLVEWLEPASPPVAPAVNQLGAMRICFYTPDIRHTYDQLVARGIDVESEPVPIQPADDNAGALALCFRDPDGTLLELVQVVKPQEAP